MNRIHFHRLIAVRARSFGARAFLSLFGLVLLGGGASRAQQERDVDALFNKGVLAIRQEKWEVALQCFDTVLADFGGEDEKEFYGLLEKQG